MRGGLPTHTRLRQTLVVCSWLFWALSLSSAQTQPAPHCGFEALLKSRMDEDTSASLWLREMETILAQSPAQHIESRSEIIVPVVVHIVWRTPEENLPDAQVWAQIEILNRDFNAENLDIQKVPAEFAPFVSRSGIRFCLASKDPWGNPASGIIRVKTNVDLIGTEEDLYYTQRGGSDAWDTDKYFNIWVARTSDLISGFGTFPQQVSPERQGIVVHPRFFGPNNSRIYQLGRVAVHEAGHFFGLHHIWHNNASCSVDDGIEDTPLQQRSYSGCPAHPQISCGSADMFMNFMDYVNDDCMHFFTVGQMNRMRAVLQLFRPGLLQSTAPCAARPPVHAFMAYPNPTAGSITIRWPASAQQYDNIRVYNTLGQLVYTTNQPIFDGISVDLSSLGTGIYWLVAGSDRQKLSIIR